MLTGMENTVLRVSSNDQLWCMLRPCLKYIRIQNKAKYDGTERVLWSKVINQTNKLLCLKENVRNYDCE